MFGGACSNATNRKVKDKLCFKFQFHATNVPCAVSERLTVTVISVNSGRVTGKTRQSSARNGLCHWLDPVEATFDLFFDAKTLEYEDKLVKFALIKENFPRSHALGEAVIDLSEYISLQSHLAVSLPLALGQPKTVLHTSIHCSRVCNVPKTDPPLEVFRTCMLTCLGSRCTQQPATTSEFEDESGQATECYVYHNPCAEEEEQEDDDVTYRTDTAYSDRKVKAYVAAFAKDVKNMRLVLRDLTNLDCGSQVVEELEAVAQGCRALVDHIRICRGDTRPLEAGGDGLTSRIEHQQLKATVGTLKLANHQLMQTVHEEKLKTQKVEAECESLVRRVMGLEAEVNVLDEEREAAILENYAGQNLVRDLCKQIGCSTKDESSDFIGQVNELRTVLLKTKEERARNYDKLEERVMEEKRKAMAKITSLEKQYGRLSKQSDKLTERYNEEFEAIRSKLEVGKSGSENETQLAEVEESSSRSSEMSTLTLSFGQEFVSKVEVEALRTEVASLYNRLSTYSSRLSEFC